MNRKQLIILVIVLLVLGGASLMVHKHSSSSWKAETGNGKVLGDFQINDVARVVIQSGTGGTLALDKKNDVWVVSQRDDYPADFMRIGDFVQTLWQLKPKEDVQAGASQLGRLDLLPPGKDEGTGTLVDLQDKDSKRIAALLIGKKFLKTSPQAPDEEGYPAGRYVMPADSNPPKVSLVSETLEQADPSPTAWLDKSFLHIDRIQSIALDSGTNQWTVSRDSDSSNEWKLAWIKPGETVDQSKILPFVSTLGAPTFNDVMPASTKPTGFDTTLTVTTFDQFIYTLKFGKADGDNLPVSVALNAYLPKERRPRKDELPGDKKRLDDEFAANAKRLADVLAMAKTFESRIYLVQRTMFDSLFIPRANLLAPPPPAPSPSPSLPVSAPSATPPPAKPSPSPATKKTPKATPKKSKSPA